MAVENYRGSDALDPLLYLMPLVANHHLLPVELGGRIERLHALLRDSGKRMSQELQNKWKDRMGELVSECEENRPSLSDGIQGLCIVTLTTLRAQFCQLVEQDYHEAACQYERALALVNPLRDRMRVEFSQAVRSMAEGPQGTPESSQEAYTKLDSLFDAITGWYMRLLDAGLWDKAGDAYSRLEGADDARRCYRHGLEILEGIYAEGKEIEDWQAGFCHLALSLANALLGDPKTWEEAGKLYRAAADAMFFHKAERSNQEYNDICASIVAPTTTVEYACQISPCAPHVWTLLPLRQRDRVAWERWTRLRAEIGERALDVLRHEFASSEEGFPVPETHCLAAALTELYVALDKWDEASKVIGRDTNFDGSFSDWSMNNLEELEAWAVPFVMWTYYDALAKGALERPDYREFAEHFRRMQDQLRKAEESHQRQELRQIRGEKLIQDTRTGVEERIGQLGDLPTIERVRRGLKEKYPWFDHLANPGSLVNAEFVQEAMQSWNWGEVVMGYCNAVEEELKRFLYKEYSAFIAGLSVDDRILQSKGKKRHSTVLYFMADIVRNNALWERFVLARMPNHKSFLCDELPGLLDALTKPRGSSAHGRMPAKARAMECRDIVLGTGKTPGLLAMLIGLRS